MNRTRILRRPLAVFDRGLRLVIDKRIRVRSDAEGTRYPFRMYRYWWAAAAIDEEARRRSRGPVIVDFGCERGLMKIFCPLIKDSRWIGLDGDVSRASLPLAEYDEIHRCDFDARLPLDDDSADIVIALHVFEHLPRPAFTIGELARILRPGGLLLAGTPVLPSPLARIREWQFRRETAGGTREAGRHTQCFWPRRWVRLSQDADLETESVIGSHLLRWSGSPLENQAWWVRLNQLWGILAPSLSGDVYLEARLTGESEGPVPAHDR